MKLVLKKILRVLLWVIGLVPVMAFCIFLLLKVPTFQDFIKATAVNYLKKKLKTEIHLGHLRIDFPKTIELDSLYLADRGGDTLLYTHRFFVDVNMLRIFSGDITINQLKVDQLVANVTRSLPDTVFNFDFILQAFGSKSEEPDTSGSSTGFGIRTIDLKQFRIRYRDVVTGYDGRLAFDTFRTHFNTFDLDSMRFALDSLVLSKVKGSLRQSAPLPGTVKTEAPSSPGSSLMPDLVFKSIVLDTIALNYDNDAAGTSGSVYLDTLLLAANHLDLRKQFIDLKEVVLTHSDMVFHRFKGTETPPEKITPATETVDTASPGWVFKVDQLTLAGNKLRYDDDLEPEAPKGIDYNHLAVEGLNINVGDGYYSADSSHAFIRDITLREKSGFELKKLTTKAVYTAHKAELDQLDLRTAATHITRKLAITYAAIDSIGSDPGNLGLLADLSGCEIDLNDVLYFQPSLDSAPSMKKLMHAVLRVNGRLDGKLGDLRVDSLTLLAADRTKLAVDAHITGMPVMDKTIFEVDLKEFSTGRKDIYSLLPAQMIPSSVNVPVRMSAKGTYKGSLRTFTSGLAVNSTDGNINLRARVRNLSDSLHAGYDVLLRTAGLDLGRLLKNDSLYGKVTMQTAVQGTGITKSSADARVEGMIRRARLKGYEYKEVAFAGGYGRQKGNLTLQSTDANLHFKLVSSADLSGQYPGVKVDLDLDSANLQALHLSPGLLKFRGKLTADFPAADIDHLNGNLLLSGWQMVKDSMQIDLDTVALYAISRHTLDSLHLEAPFARADVFGHYQFSKAGVFVRSLMEHYFGSDSTTQAVTDSAGKQDMQIKLALLDHPLWHLFIPGLQSFSGGAFEGELASSPQKVQLTGDIPQVVLGGMSVDSLKIDVRSDTGKVKYSLAVDRVDNGPVKMYRTTLTGDAAHNRINVNLKVHDQDDKNKYQLAGLLGADNGTYRFSFDPDSLLLNYERWQMQADNYLLYSEKGLLAHEVKLERNGQYLSVNSPEKTAGSPVEMTFHNFRLETLTRIASADTALVSGALNGKAVVEDLTSSPVFTTDLTIDSLALREQPVGNLAVKVNNKQANAYAVDIALTGDSNDLKVTGTYQTQPQGIFDLHIAVPALSVASAQAFTFGQVEDGSGFLSGDLRLTGTTARPRIAGDLNFKEVGLTVTKVNDYLRMPDETIKFDDRGIHFDHFTIIDSLDNKAFVNGDVLTTNFSRYRFALDLSAKNFRALNARKNQDEMYYGPVFVDVDARIRGNESLPKVDVDLTLKEKSVLTVVLPGSNPSLESSEGIVEFIDAGHINDTVKLAVPATPETRYTPLKGMQLSADISVDTAAVLNLIIDPTNGDNLRVKGDATLNMTMDPGGKISLTGRYEISEGAYSMSLERMIKRKFDIRKGSAITWTGDPTSADLDLTAVYNVEAPAVDLVEDQLTNLDESAKNTYKQKLPFEVLMNIKGELMEPDISFSLDMPETSRNAFSGSVYTRLNQINTDPSEVNKQTLGLLVFGHFIADNPFASAGGGTSMETMVRQSASKILSQQLNNLAGDLIKGVDVNFDLESSEDYSTGEAENKTDLNVGVSKSLFNDRTTVYVGSNIQLEGPQNDNRKSSQIAGDVAIEYKLSRDGRYRLRGYRKNKYEGVIEGEFIETGLSFIIVMDYDHFKELFQKQRKK